jgi:hypothetical protein
MADPFIVGQLQRQSLFAKLSADQLQRVAEVSQVIQAQPGQYLFAQGQPVQAAQIFVSGRGALLSANAQGQSSQLGTVEAGQLINENAFFNDNVESASLRLLEPSVVIIIPREPVRQLMARDPALQANLRVLDASGGRDTRKILFRGQRANETVFRLYHRHWWGFVRHAWIPFLLAGLFLVISVIVDTQFPGIGLVFGCLTLTVPVFSLAFLLWEWRNDQLIITDQRLVAIHMQAWRLTRSVSGIPLDRIGEVQVDIPGGDIFANLFGYGTLVVRTTADRSGLTIRFMPDPSSVQRTVFEQRDLYQQRSQQVDDDEALVRAQIAQALGVAAPGAGQATSGQDAMNEAEEVHFTAGKAGPPGFRTRFVTTSGAVCYRHHWIRWLRMQVVPLVIMGLVFGCAGVSLSGLIELPLPVLLPLGFVIALAVGVWFYLRDWDWRNDMMIIESDTVTFQYKRPLWLQNQIEQIGLSKLDNITSTVGGIVGNLLNVGTISMTLMGSSEQKTFRTIGDPEAVVAEISWRTQRIKERVREDVQDNMRGEIAQYLQVYHEMMTGQAPGSAAQSTQFSPPAMPTQPMPAYAPTAPAMSYPTQPAAPAPLTQPAAGYPTQPVAPRPTPVSPLPANLTFQSPGAAPAGSTAPPPGNPPAPPSGSRPPRVPRPRPSDMPD